MVTIVIERVLRVSASVVSQFATKTNFNAAVACNGEGAVTNTRASDEIGSRNVIVEAHTICISGKSTVTCTNSCASVARRMKRSACTYCAR